MIDARRVTAVLTRTPTMEGAGVRLHRVFGKADPAFDPFLLLDDFGSDNPADYLAGFPWHPHRGMETVTYVLAGEVEHSDSLGNRGVIRARRRAVDDRGQRHRAPGDAAALRGTVAGLSALGQPAGGAAR